MKIGDVIFAKSPNERRWNAATVVSIDNEQNTVVVAWSGDKKECETLPNVPECIEIGTAKRERKKIVYLDEQEDLLREVIGIRKRKAPGLPKEVVEPQPKKISHNVLEMINIDELSDKNLCSFAELFRPFITEKTYERLISLQTPNIKPKLIKPASINQPAIMTNIKMREYQLGGLSWIVQHFQKGINAILADEMGLGKTIQSISFFAHLKSVLNISGPHLVVVPLSVLFNWIAECKKFCPSLKVLRLHSNDNTELQRLKNILNHELHEYDVYVTTYEMIKGKMEGSLKRVLWTSIILDEGHRIKNNETNISKACMLYKTRFKLILTGTPVQNNLSEIYSLLNFLHPHIFNDELPFSNAFQINSTNNDININKNILNKAHYMLRPFILRRVKNEVEKTLMPKLETIIHCPMSDMQRFWIRQLLLRDCDLLLRIDNEKNTNNTKSGQNAQEKDMKQQHISIDMSHSSSSSSSLAMMATHSNGVTSKQEEAVSSVDWKKLQSLLAQLRKAANHPYLFPNAETLVLDPVSGAPVTTHEIITASGKMLILDRLLTKLLKNDHRVVLFSQYTKTLDIISDYLEYRGYSFSRLDGSTNRVYREVLITQFNKAKCQKKIFILSTRAGGEGVNLYTADTVILYDSDWNPQVDVQAMARVHRIGQSKKVHVYRLISSGSVEERIVQRAQKKLYLDSIINRGSTQNAENLDTLRNDKDEKEKDLNVGFDGNNDEEGLSVMMSALKFGWNACFKANGGDNSTLEISDQDLDAIIDRNRGVVSEIKPTAVVKSESIDMTVVIPTSSLTQTMSTASTGSNLLFENQECSVDTFEESAPLLDLRTFEGEKYVKDAKSGRLSDIGEEWSQYMQEQKRKRLEAEAAALKAANSKKVKKRDRVSRTNEVFVEDVGMVKILKSNDYDLLKGEPSVFEREMKGRVEEGWGSTTKTINKQKFVNEETCLICHDYGNIVCCDNCPASYHTRCLRVAKKYIPTRFSCPHHKGCASCQRSGGAIGFTFRCENCAMSYCEDCLPGDVEILETCIRFQLLGYTHPRNCCYIRCSDRCKEIGKAYDKEYYGEGSDDEEEDMLNGMVEEVGEVVEADIGSEDNGHSAF